MDYDDMCEMLRILTIPLGPMAADAITALQARIAELEAELSRQNEANDMLAEERDAFWKSQSYWMASQKDEQQRAERAEAQLAAARARVAELDLQRNQAIAEIAVWAQDCGKAQAELAAARAELDVAVRTVGKVQSERDIAYDQLAAARALLREVREWIPYYRWIPDLRERVDAAIVDKAP